MKRFLKVAVLGLTLGASISGYSKDLGVYGETFPIVEVNVLDFIQARLQEYKKSGKLDEMQRQFEQNTRDYALRPTPVAGLTTTTNPHSYNIDPSFMVQQDIRDLHGKILIAKGTRINPFDSTTLPEWFKRMHPDFHFNETLVFLNADDARQVNWFKHYAVTSKQLIKLILTGGGVEDAYKALHYRIYFDQGGKLSQKFHLQHIPAVVMQNKTQWQVQEIDVSAFSDKVSSNQ